MELNATDENGIARLVVTEATFDSSSSSRVLNTSSDSGDRLINSTQTSSNDPQPLNTLDNEQSFNLPIPLPTDHVCHRDFSGSVWTSSGNTYVLSKYLLPLVVVNECVNCSINQIFASYFFFAGESPGLAQDIIADYSLWGCATLEDGGCEFL